MNGVPFRECLLFLFTVHLPVREYGSCSDGGGLACVDHQSAVPQVHVVLDFAWRNHIACKSGLAICAGLTGWPPSSPTTALPAAVANHLLLRALPMTLGCLVFVIFASVCLEVLHRESSKSGPDRKGAPSSFPPAKSAAGRLIRLIASALLMLHSRLSIVWQSMSYSHGVLIGWPLAGIIVASQVGSFHSFLSSCHLSTCVASYDAGRSHVSRNELQPHGDMPCPLCGACCRNARRQGHGKCECMARSCLPVMFRFDE